jgi:hypothetical protein
MRVSDKCIIVAIVGTLTIGSAAAQSVRPVSPQTLRNPTGIDRITQIKAQRLQRIAIPLDPALTPPLDMTGWTAVTKGGATGSPWIISFESKALLMIGGKDNKMYDAEPDMLAPKPIDSGAWTAWSTITSNASIICQPSSFKEDGEMPGDRSVDCLVSKPGQTNLMHIIAISDPATIAEAAKFGYAPYMGDAFVTIPGAPGPTFWLSKWKAPGQAKDWSPTALPIAAWDGSMHLSQATAATDYRKVTTASWQQQNFYAFALPACDLRINACVLADSGGDKLQMASIDPAAGFKMSSGAKLPDVPGGAGAAKGELSIVTDLNWIRVFVRGKDGKLYMGKGTDPQALSWTSLGGSVAVGARPACVLFKNGITCAIRATDNRVYMRRIPITENGL